MLVLCLSSAPKGELQGKLMRLQACQLGQSVLKGLSGRRRGNAGNMVVSPITGELVPVEQMAEHMRISLIDPR